MNPRRRKPQKVGSAWNRMKFFIHIMCQAFSQTHRGDEKIRGIWRLCCPISSLKTESAIASCPEGDLVGFWISERICGDNTTSLSCLFQFLTTLNAGSLLVSGDHCMFPQRNIFGFFLIFCSFIWQTQTVILKKTVSSHFLLCFNDTHLSDSAPQFPIVISFPGWLYLHYLLVPVEKIFHTGVIFFFPLYFPIPVIFFSHPQVMDR